MIMVRYGELGLKSPKVRKRFEKLLMDDIERRLIEDSLSFIAENERGRIFYEVDDEKPAVELMRKVPGIHSISPVTPCSSEWGELIRCLEEVGRETIGKDMTYGLKVRRASDKKYSSQQVAVEGGSAVVSHLEEGDARVDLRNPDIWIEVEIRGSMAYIFSERIQGLGGMPYSSQGKAILFLPAFEGNNSQDDLTLRGALSYLLMERRGTRVIPCTIKGFENVWKKSLEDVGLSLSKRPYILDEGKLRRSLLDACKILSVNVVVAPMGIDSMKGFPVLHDEGEPVACLFPTASMGHGDLVSWVERLMVGT